MAGTPPPDVAVPDVVARLAGNVAVRPVWENEVGGLTFEVGAGRGRRFVKWAPAGCGDDLRAEAARLSWAAPYATVPTVLDSGVGDAGTWLVTAGIEGESAVSERWRRRPRDAVTAMGEGLRALHEALPTDTCPFSWSAARRRHRALRRLEAGRSDPGARHVEHRGLTDEQAAIALADTPPVDRAVVCHGDACAPNTLMTADGRWCAHVDLGALGVADRWADLAVATWSTAWNFGPGWEDLLLSAYGVERDPERTRYYRLLWDLSP